MRSPSSSTDFCTEAAMGLMQAKSAELGMGLAYRTVQYPQMEDCASSGKAKDLQIGERYHVTYLNAAGREVLMNSCPVHAYSVSHASLSLLTKRVFC